MACVDSSMGAANRSACRAGMQHLQIAGPEFERPLMYNAECRQLFQQLPTTARCSFRGSCWRL
eukprot:15422044-Alexandrium_andersonii.AAC.1